MTFSDESKEQQPPSSKPHDKEKKEHKIEFIQVAKGSVGGTFGELSLIYNRARAATVVALTDWVFAVVDKAKYNKTLWK